MFDMPSGPMALEAFEYLIASWVAKGMKVVGLVRRKQCAVFVIVLVFLLDT